MLKMVLDSRLAQQEQHGRHLEERIKGPVGAATGLLILIRAEDDL
jgi:hypothetical protein